MQEAVKDIKDGNLVTIGGFGLGGAPQALIKGLVANGAKNLTVASITAGVDDWGVGLLLRNRQIKKLVAAYIGENKVMEEQYLGGEIEVEFTPMGNLAEKIRAGGAGIPAFYTPTGVGTLLHKGGMPQLLKKGTKGKQIAKPSPKKESKMFNGKEYIMETALFADFALIKAWKADKLGNLQYRLTSRNINKDMAQAAKVVIAEVEEIVETGELNPNEIHTPSVYVDRIVVPDKIEKRIERPKFSDDVPKKDKKADKGAAMRDKIAKRASQELRDGMYVNLGIGIPTLIPKFLPKDVKIILQGENGILGMGNYPKRGEEDPDLINASKECVTQEAGSSIFSINDSFSMIRGQHLDMTVLGSMEVSKTGDLASWIVPGQKVKGMGGAMDLASCGSTVVVTMEHTNKGKPKILDKCSIPLTGLSCVNTVITELGVFRMRDGELVLTEIAEETTLENVLSQTGFKVKVADDLK